MGRRGYVYVHGIDIRESNLCSVDRGNGFEKKLFQRQNERKRKNLASYEWSVDDM